MKPSKDETVPASKVSVPTKGAPPSSSKAASTSYTGPVTEDEIRAVLMQKTPVTTQDLVGKFKSRLKSKEVYSFIFYQLHLCFPYFTPVHLFEIS